MHLYLKCTLLALILATASAMNSPLSFTDYLNVSFSPGGVGNFDWQLGTATPGSSYTVSITNLNTNVLEQQFNTTSTSATVYNLKSNTPYQFKVQKGTNFIISNDTNP